MERHGTALRRGVYAAVFLAVLALSFLTPMLADDFSYCFSWADVSRVRSLAQIVPSMAVHRQVTNGRVFTHGLVQLLLIGPKAIFNLLNALFAALLLRLFERLLSPALSEGKRALLLALAALALWDMTPVFGQVFLWLDGAVNYGWGVVLFLLFLLPFTERWLHRGPRLAPWQIPLYGLLGFLAGTWSESGAPSVFLMGLVLLFALAQRERKLDPGLLFGLVCELAGILFLALAPATQGRAGGGFQLALLPAKLGQVLLFTLRNLWPLYLFYALCLVAALAAHIERDRLRLSLLLLFGGLCSLGAYALALYVTYRHLCLAVCFTLLAALLLLGELLAKGRPLLPRIAAALLALAFLYLFPRGLLDIGVTYKHSLEREAVVAEALANGEREARLQIYVPATRYSAAYKLEDLYPEADVWPNYSLAAYYGLDAVVGYLPGEE